MIKKIGFKLAILSMLVLFVCAFIFHILVLAGIIPYHFVWGGRLENTSQMRLFESVSIIITLVIIVIVAIKGGYVKSFVPGKIVNLVLWMLVVMFAFNTVGNVFAVTFLETVIGAPVTFISAVFCYRIVIESQSLPAK